MKKHGNSKFKVSRLKLNRGYIRSIIKNPNKMRVRVYKTNKILKFKGRPNLKVDTITEVRLTLGEARRCGLLRYESEEDVQVWSKDISLCNRFVYDVARPELNETQKLVLWKVGIRNLHDHKYKGKRYSDTRTYVLKRILK